MKFPDFLRVAIVTNFDIFRVKENEDGHIQVTGGLESNFLKVLSEGLHFNYSVLIPEDKEWGRLTDDGKWTGVMGLVSTNRSDIGISKLGITFQKLSAVDFSYPYSIESVTFATNLPGYKSKETAVILPYSYGVWIAFIISLVFITFAFKYILKYDYTFPSIFLHAVGCIFYQAKGLKAEKYSERILVSAWIFSAMLLSYSYTAVLLSFLTLPIKEQPVNSKNRLLQALDKNHYKCVTPRGSAVLKTLQDSEDETTATIAKRIEENNWLIEPSKDVLAETFNQTRIAVINPRNHFRILNNEQILIANDYFFLLYWGIAINKNFCCKKDLDVMVHRILASGLYLKSENEFYFQSQLKYSEVIQLEASAINALKLRDVVSAFLFLLSGYILSIIAFVIEITICKKKP